MVWRTLVLGLFACASCGHERPISEVSPAGDNTRGDAAADADAAAAPSCGNSLLDPGELCDSSARSHECPNKPNDCVRVTRDPCWMWRVEGDECNRECVQGAGICEDIIDPFETASFRPCRNECPPGTDPDDPWD